MDKFAMDLPPLVIALSLVLAVLALVAGLCGLALLKQAAPFVDSETDISSAYASLHGAESRLKTAEVARGLMGLVCSGVVLFWMIEGLKYPRLAVSRHPACRGDHRRLSTVAGITRAPHP